MIPYIFSDGPRRVWTYKDFQAISIPRREKALAWLKGRTRLNQYFDDYQRATQAANDDVIDEIKGILIVHELVMMLYCWVENGRDDVRAKLAYVEGRSYNPLIQ